MKLQRVLKSEYDFYLEQLQEKNLENKNLLSAQLFGNSSIELILDNLNTVTHIDEFSSLDYDILFSETNGYLCIKESEKILILDISNKV